MTLLDLILRPFVRRWVKKHVRMHGAIKAVSDAELGYAKDPILLRAVTFRELDEKLLAQLKKDGAIAYRELRDNSHNCLVLEATIKTFA